MSRRALGLRSPLSLAGGFFVLCLLGAGCKQGVGDRCEVDTDCTTSHCDHSSTSGDPQNGICCDPNDIKTCMIQSGVGGASGSIGGNTGTTDADTSDTSAVDSSTDSSAD